MKRGLTCIFCGAAMCVLILDSPTALAGAAEGVELCLKTLIPGLFPFFILSGLLMAAMPKGGLLLSGILGGYPVGARNAAQAYRNGVISKEEAERMAVICNCPGPSFIFGVAGQLFPPGRTVLLWAVYLSGAAVLWLILPKSHQASTTGKTISLTESMHSALMAMASVCGWVVLMRTLLAVLGRWFLFFLPHWGQAAFAGILELTNGIMMLRHVEENLRFTLASGMLGFGGLCVMMQTLGVTNGLPMKRYFPGKLFQGCFCLALSALLTGTPIPVYVWAVLAALALGSVGKLRKIENNYGNLRPIGV